MGKQKCVQSAGFQQRKATFLSKDDKSSAGGIDAHAVEVCAVVNERADAFTTSSCSGRAFLWRGQGVKSTSTFARYRVTHELIADSDVYFDLTSLAEEVVDGAWEVERHRTREKTQTRSKASNGRALGCLAGVACRLCGDAAVETHRQEAQDPVVWLRFEPFILHVCCRDFAVASNLIMAARSVFKNVGVQSWTESKVMISIWGDEGLDMALTDSQGRPVFLGQSAWLQELVNSRHRRNWTKIDRFTEALRALPADSASLKSDMALDSTTDTDEGLDSTQDGPDKTSLGAFPKHFDVIGDVAVLSALSPEADRAAIGAKLLAENRKIKVAAVRCGSLQTEHRKPCAMDIIGGFERRPLMTTHTEFGVRYVIDLEAVFFNPRMGPERQRICSQVQAGEQVCVLFAGCCPEALQIVAKTDVASVTAVELNPDAVQCARRSLQLLSQKEPARASRLQVIEGDACAIAAGFQERTFHRVLAPRPKGKTDAEDDELVARFLQGIVPLLRSGGICHWYDFVADWEFPSCSRSVARIVDACKRSGRSCTVLRCAAANNKPVAERQYRTVIDFVVA